jgi:hypothetical protein
LYPSLLLLLLLVALSSRSATSSDPRPHDTGVTRLRRTLGEGARERRGGINKIRLWGGPFPSGHG